MTDLPSMLRSLLARRSPVVTDDDVAAAIEFVRLALEQAAADHAAYAARSTKAPMARRLVRIGSIASQAAEGDAGALDRLRSEIGDGGEIDDAIASGVGGAVAGFTDAASSLARTERRHARWWAGQIAAACKAATCPAPRHRRGRRFFAVLALAFAYCDLTGEAPTATLTEECIDAGRDCRFEWRRAGPFADFVAAVDAVFNFAEGESLDAAIGAALRVGRGEIFLHLSTPGRPWPASFGSPIFALEASGEEADGDA